MKEVNESMAEGIGDYSVEDAVTDIEEDITDMQTKAEAINELEDEQGDDLEDELADLTTDSEVAGEMETLRQEFSEGEVEVQEIEDEEELEKEVA